ncbi:MAG: sensor domain-containing diguanylate cyclase [Gammaproteobacteria bacterium]|nr:sensor domain-containing diguanylate cyclase [Gammaproteobacteria bacterium]
MKAGPPYKAPDADTRAEVRALRDLLRAVGTDAAHNEQVLRRFHERELALLTAGDLPRLLECLTSGMRASFGLDSVKLKLIDPFHVIRDLLADRFGAEDCLARDIELCTDVAAVRAAFDDSHSPWLGEWDEPRHLPLFGLRLRGSVALLPLRHVDGLAGFLCLGSRDRGRFGHGQATDFLAHMASVAAVCLENAVNRERLRLLGLTDTLTGLYNRRHLEHRIEQEVTRARRYAQSLACLFVDADHFKRINDLYGHAAGDQVLVALAQRLRARLRTSDLATRYGGEEFAVLLPHTGLDSAESLAEEIRSGIAAEPVILPGGPSVPVSVSIGVAALGDDVRQPPDAAGRALLDAADRAVYIAKQAGRNRVACERRTGG